MATITAAPAAPSMQSKTEPRASKYLTFHLGSEEFAIQVLEVREIIGVEEIAGVPQTPHYVKGAINLRGKVTPVIDLRLKFGLLEISRFRLGRCHPVSARHGEDQGQSENPIGYPAGVQRAGSSRAGDAMTARTRAAILAPRPFPPQGE